MSSTLEQENNLNLLNSLRMNEGRLLVIFSLAQAQGFKKFIKLQSRNVSSERLRSGQGNVLLQLTTRTQVVVLTWLVWSKVFSASLLVTKQQKMQQFV